MSSVGERGDGDPHPGRRAQPEAGAGRDGPAGVQQPGDGARLVGHGHPHVHPAAPVRGDAPRRERPISASRRSPYAAATARGSTAPSRPQVHHGPLQQPADPAGPEPLPAAHPVDGDGVAR